MRARYLLLACFVGLGLALVVGAVMAGRPAQAAATCSRYVLGTTGSDLSDCSSGSQPCRTVQRALRVAAANDMICVADDVSVPGPTIYTGTLVITKPVTLDGAWEADCTGMFCLFTRARCAPENVVLNANEAGRVISITGASPTISCFTITGGNAAGLGGDAGSTVEHDAGGGIYSKNSAPIITHNVITGNYGCSTCTSYGIGGGVYMQNAPASAVISGNVIANNAGASTILGWGGGIALRNSSAQVSNNTIQRNSGGTAGDGGGIYVLDGSPTIGDNQILTNTAGAGVACNGGGVYVKSGTPVTIERNLIQDNRGLFGDGDPNLTSRGGGIYYDGAAAIIRDNTLYGNTGATNGFGAGGGMYLGNLTTLATVTRNTVKWNRASYYDNSSGGGLYLDTSTATIADNVIGGNTAASGDTGWGGGVYIARGGGLIQDNTIEGNLALLGAITGTGWGGGVAISNSVARLQDNVIQLNVGTLAPSGDGVGGGIYVYGGAPQIIRNRILTNTTGSATGHSGLGGGVYAQYAQLELKGNTILDNNAPGSVYGQGGGVRIAQCPAFTLTNNIIARNTASKTGSGAAILGGVGQLAHNTVAENVNGGGVGLRVDTSSIVTLTNNIIYSQTVGISNTTATVNARYTLFDSNGQNYVGSVTNSNQVAGPAALRPNYHLQGSSGAIDRGLALSWVTDDVDGDPRPYGSAPDVGADEKGLACDLYVLNTDGGDSGDCSDARHPCRTVQYALSQATNGDRVCVADNPLQPGPSVYTGTNTVNKSVTLDGAWQASCVDPSDLTCAFASAPCAPQNVVLDAQGIGRVITVTSNGRITPTIRCLTLTGGRAVADSGGGLYSSNAALVVAQTVITNNVSDDYGGGIYIASGSATVTASDVLSNSAGYGGGGIELSQDVTAQLHGNRIADNHASYGGGIEMDRASLTATANLILRNQSGSAWMVSGSGGHSLAATNNVVANNSGAGLRIYNYYASLAHNTIVSNTGSGIEGTFTATLVLTNNIIAYNTGAGLATSAGSSAAASYNLFWGNGSNPITGTHAVLANPMLSADGYHLRPGSAAVNAGTSAGVVTDIDGEARMGAPDIGADEYIGRVYMPVVLRN